MNGGRGAALRRAASAETSSSQEVGEWAAQAAAPAGVAERAERQERAEGLLTLHDQSAPPSSPEGKAGEETYGEEGKQDVSVRRHKAQECT